MDLILKYNIIMNPEVNIFQGWHMVMETVKGAEPPDGRTPTTQFIVAGRLLQRGYNPWPQALLRNERRETRR
jgi:hypothetical protein